MFSIVLSVLVILTGILTIAGGSAADDPELGVLGIGAGTLLILSAVLSFAVGFLCLLASKHRKYAFPAMIAAAVSAVIAVLNFLSALQSGTNILPSVFRMILAMVICYAGSIVRTEPAE